MQLVRGGGVFLGMKPIAYLALLGLFALIVFARQSATQRAVPQTHGLSRPPLIVQDPNTEAFRLKIQRIVVDAERSIQKEKAASLPAGKTLRPVPARPPMPPLPPASRSA
jgi:hypothetical protein